jgi:hypothetical protein
MNQTTLVSVAIIVSGCLLIAYDERYGPKDDVMYLRIFPVMLLMVGAACVLICQAVGRIIHWGAQPNKFNLIHTRRLLPRRLPGIGSRTCGARPGRSRARPRMGGGFSILGLLLPGLGCPFRWVRGLPWSGGRHT